MARILFLNFSPRAQIHLDAHSGSSSGTANLLKALHAAGHEVISVVSGEGQRELQAKAAFAELRRLLPSSPLSFMSTIYEMLHNRLTDAELRRFNNGPRVHFIYERFAPFHHRAQRLADCLDIPYIVEIHGPSSGRGEFGPSHLANTADRIQEKVVRRADGVRVISSAVKIHYTKRGIEASKMHMLPNAADTELFDPSLTSSDVRGLLGLENRIVVGFVGSMHAYHGLPILFKAASLISSASSEFRFLLVGPVGQDATRALEEKGLANLFALTGRVPHSDVPKYIMAMDICVIPDSNWYGSPIKLFEYGAMGKPVVAPRLGPVQDVVEDRRSALLFPPADVKALVSSILELAANERMRKHLAYNWMQEVRLKHTWEKRAQEITSIFEAAR